ncbi:MAG TPA: (Fe-S)-binding protein [Bacilli bacterium]|nr:(Fe-S)-binding protein [Bacilli bacterium]
MLGILILTVTALLLSILLVFVSSLVNKENPKIKEIENMLPGLNCGGCGFGSCNGMACQILKDKEAYKNCRPLRGEKKEALEKYLNENKN